MDEFYTLQVAGLTRKLPVCRLNEKMSIAAFIMFNDVELTIACAKELLAKAPEFDVLVTAAAKGIQSGKPYITARKGVKLYMKNPVKIDDQSITTANKQTLVIDQSDIDQMNGKRLLLVDDVISTGGSMHAIEALVSKSSGTIVGRCAVLAEGDAAERKDIFFLQTLPLFFHE